MTDIQPRLQADVCLYLVAIFLPFLSVFLKTGCGCDLLINVLLCLLGWLPGVIRKLKISLCFSCGVWWSRDGMRDGWLMNGV